MAAGWWSASSGISLIGQILIKSGDLLLEDAVEQILFPQLFFELFSEKRKIKVRIVQVIEGEVVF